jgi:hypothetical protein
MRLSEEGFEGFAALKELERDLDAESHTFDELLNGCQLRNAA